MPITLGEQNTENNVLIVVSLSKKKRKKKFGMLLLDETIYRSTIQTLHCTKFRHAKVYFHHFYISLFRKIVIYLLPSFLVFRVVLFLFFLKRRHVPLSLHFNIKECHTLLKSFAILRSTVEHLSSVVVFVLPSPA